MQTYLMPVRTDYVAVVAFALFIVGAIFPWRDGFGDGYFAHHRIIQVGFLAFIAICMVSCVWRKATINPYDSLFKLGALLFYVGGLLSGLMAISVPQAGLEYLHWVLLGLLFISCSGIYADAFLKPLMMILLVAHSLLIFLSILYLLFALVEGDPLQANVIYPATENIRFYNQIQVFVLPLLLLLLKHPRIGFLAFVFFTANVLLLCIGGARGAALAVAVILLVAAIVLPLLRAHVVLALLASALAVTLYSILWWFGVDGLHDISRSGSSGRVEMWLEIIRNLEWHHLIWGVGPANYVAFSQQFSFGHPHNSVLQWILEWGGISFVGAVLIVGRILYKSVLYVMRTPDDIFALGLFLSWFAALAYSLVDGVIVMPIAQTLFVAFAGLLWGKVEAKPASQDVVSMTAPTNVWKSFMTGLLILLITVPYVYFASQYYVQQSSASSDIKGPRFWINGVPLQWPE